PENALFDPKANTLFGTYYLSGLLKKYEGNLVFALAAYNGSEAAVDTWRQRFGNLPLTQFIEEITYGETKNYVKKILSNYLIYHRLYGTVASLKTAQSQLP